MAIVYEDDVEWSKVQEQILPFSEHSHQIVEAAKKAIREDEDDVEVSFDPRRKHVAVEPGKVKVKPKKKELKDLKVKLETGKVEIEAPDIKNHELNAKVSRANLRIEAALGVKYTLGRDRTPTKRCPNCGSYYRTLPQSHSKLSGERFELRCPHPKCNNHLVMIRGEGRTVVRNARTGEIVKL